jgi:phenylalanyl-tRNA synthetase beta chain
MKEEARPNFKNCLKIFLGAKYIGFLGKLNESTGDKFELKKSLFYCELDINSLLLEKKLKMFEPFSSYPAIFRDISLALRKDKSFKDVYAIIGRYKESISDYSLVNFYEGKDLAEGFCAFCLRLFYQSASKTLVAEEVDTIHNRIRAELAASDGVTLR